MRQHQWMRKKQMELRHQRPFLKRTARVISVASATTTAPIRQVPYQARYSSRKGESMWYPRSSMAMHSTKRHRAQER